jgi:squalene-associated FAD-dependent desaturase
MKVAIVGAGWAGLAAAITLAEQGVCASVFEAGNVPGGRARRLAREAVDLDNGQHLLMGAYRQTLALIDKVAPGNSVTGLLRVPLTLVYPDEFSLVAPNWPAPLHLLGALVGAKGLSATEKFAAIRFMLKLRSHACETDQTVALALHGQPDALKCYLWNPLCVAALNTPTETASMQVFRRVLLDALLGTRAESDFLIPRLDLGTLFAEPATDWLRTQGTHCYLRHRIHRLEQCGDRWALHHNASGEVEVYDAVILACGPQTTRRLLEGHPKAVPSLAALDALSYEPIVTVYLQYPCALNLPQPLLAWREPMPMFLFDHASSHGKTGRVALVVSASGPHLAWDDNRWLAEIRAKMEALLGPLPPPGLLARVTEKRATFACLAGLVRPPAHSGLLRVWLAGDHIAGPYPATLEGATRSGVESARLLLDAL